MRCWRKEAEMQQGLINETFPEATQNPQRDRRLNYKCIHKEGNRVQKWEGTIKLIIKRGRYIEAVITGRGSYFHVITGPHMNGYFICIPNYEVGSELVKYDDVFWNKERLGRSMSIIDATTVAMGLKHLKEIIE